MLCRTRSISTFAAVVLVTTLGALVPVIPAHGQDTPPTAPPPPEAAPGPPTPGPAAPRDAAGGSGDAAAPTPSPAVPARYARMIPNIPRTAANNTRELLRELEQLRWFGITPDKASLIGMGRFPVAGDASFVDDWWFPRYVPRFHLHVGTDIFAARGTPVRAPVDGRVRITNGKVGGLSVYVHASDGTYFYMAHLSGIAKGLSEGQQVRTGQVVGYVGDSGNARGGKPHVHFEIHPRGGGPINPKPYLDRFIADARAQVPALVDYLRNMVATRGQGAARAALGQPEPEVPGRTIRLPSRFGRPTRTLLLWRAATGAVNAAMSLAQEQMRSVAAEIDWGKEATRGPDPTSSALVRALLEPITPRAFAHHL